MEPYTRIVVETRDVAILIGRSHKIARQLLRNMRIFYKKSRYDWITISEFSRYMNMDVSLVLTILNAGGTMHIDYGKKRKELKGK